MNRSMKALISIIIGMVLLVAIYITFSNGKDDYEIYQKTMQYETKDTESGKVIYKERVIDQGIISTSHYLILAVECTITGMLIALIIFTEGYKKTIKETFNVELRIGVYLLVVLIIKISLQAPLYIVLKNDIDQKVSVRNLLKIKGDSEGQTIYNSNIDLSQYKDTNISIKQGGEYTITGEFTNTILVDSVDPVVLNLDNVTINNQYSGVAIKNERDNQLTINLINGTTNTFISNGEGVNETQGTIVSNGDLLINGDGQLNIDNNQLSGYAINCSSKVEILSGIISIDALNTGIKQENKEKSINIKGGTLYVLAENDAILTNQPVEIERGVVFVQTIRNSNGEFNYNIKDGTFIVINSQYVKPVSKDKTTPTLIFNLNEEDYIDENKIITLTDANQNAIVSFLTKAEARQIIISSKIKYLNGILIKFVIIK